MKVLQKAFDESGYANLHKLQKHCLAMSLVETIRAAGKLKVDIDDVILEAYRMIKDGS